MVAAKEEEGMVGEIERKMGVDHANERIKMEIAPVQNPNNLKLEILAVIKAPNLTWQLKLLQAISLELQERYEFLQNALVL